MPTPSGKFADAGMVSDQSGSDCFFGPRTSSTTQIFHDKSWNVAQFHISDSISSKGSASTVSFSSHECSKYCWPVQR